MKREILSPSKYVQGSGLIKNLKNYSEKLSQKGIYVLVDKFIYENYKKDIEYSYREDLSNLHIEIFSGQSTKKEIYENITKLKEKNSDIIIAIGGGKTIDTAKAISYYTNLPIIIVPTIASTDSPCSSLSVLYKENGEFEKYLYLNSNPNIVIVDTEIILKAPSRFLVAGMGDALSTYYEASACYKKGIKNSKTVLSLAKLCLDTIIDNGYEAKKSNENKILSEEFENVVEANIYLSGIGFESGGEAAAHSIHNGLTILSELKNKLHGEVVAFSTIVQLVMEKRPQKEIMKIINFCKIVGLPTSLKDLGIEKIDREILLKIVEKILEPHESIYNMPFNITKELVLYSILKADELGINN